MKKTVFRMGGVLVACLVLWMSWAGETAGVLVSNEIPQRARTAVDEVGLEEGEQLVAFTEFSMGTLSEYAALTNQRLLYLNDGHTTSLDFADIASVEMTDAPIGADIIIASSDGQLLRLALANDPEVFLRVLEAQRERAGARAATE